MSKRVWTTLGVMHRRSEEEADLVARMARSCADTGEIHHPPTKANRGRNVRLAGNLWSHGRMPRSQGKYQPDIRACRWSKRCMSNGEFSQTQQRQQVRESQRRAGPMEASLVEVLLVLFRSPTFAALPFLFLLCPFFEALSIGYLSFRISVLRNLRSAQT